MTYYLHFRQEYY